MKVGFTGTRHGMTEAQKAAFTELLLALRAVEFHHGDCVGADDEAAEAVHARRVTGEPPWCKLIVHPPTDEKLRAFNKRADYQGDDVRPAKTHFARNRDIVDVADIVIGCPGAPTWQPRGGTFYTMDYAVKKRKPVKVIWPDGSIEDR